MITKRDIYNIHQEKIFPFTGPYTSEFCPLSAGVTYEDPNYQIRRYNGDHYVFEYVLSGTGHVEFNGESITLSPGDAYILHPCTFHHYYSDHSDPWVKVWFNGQGSLIGHLLSDYQLGFNCYVHHLDRGDHLLKMKELLEQDPSHCKNELGILLHQHIICFSETLNGQLMEHSAALTMKTYIDQNVTAPLNISEVAAQAHLSTSRAGHLFKEEYHMTPYHYYLTRKLELAQNLLRTTSLSIQEISDVLGFPDYRHFTSLFKRWTGVTPSWFRTDLSRREDYITVIPQPPPDPRAT